MLIILEPARKQVSHKLDDLVVVVLLISLLNRRIILVNDDDGRNTVVLMEHCRQIQQRSGQLHFAYLALSQLFIGLFAVLVALTAGQQFFMPPGFLCENISNRRKSLRPSVELNILERQENHRVLPLIVPVLLTAAPNLLVAEINRSILVTFFKKSAQHIHIQRLAEASRTGKQRHHRALVNEILNHHRLVDVVVFRRCKAVVGYANGQRPPRRPLCFSESARLNPLIHWLLRICRNHPAFPLLFRTDDFSVFAERRNSPFRYVPARRRFFDRNHFSHTGHLRASFYRYIIPD